MFRAQHFLNVKFLSLDGIYDKVTTFPYEMFCEFPKLEELKVRACSFGVIFSFSERPLNDTVQKATLMKRLTVSFMEQLKHIWDGKCQVDPILQNLKTLKVSDCDTLINLGPSFVSLENLINLDVCYCDELINLLTPSTAQTLVQLTRLKITRCK